MLNHMFSIFLVNTLHLFHTRSCPPVPWDGWVHQQMDSGNAATHNSTISEAMFHDVNDVSKSF